jgi:hypothetical protein
LTHVREPLSFPRAITKIAAVLDYPAMARAVGRGERLMRKWSHPTSGAFPTLAQAVLLDQAYVAAGGDGMPLLEAYAQQLDVAIGREIACQLALSAAVAVAAKEFGEAVAASLAVARPGALNQGAVFHALNESEEASAAMAVVVRHLTSFLPGGAGSPGEAVGGTQ